MGYEEILRKQMENLIDGEGLEQLEEQGIHATEGLAESFTLENILNATLEGESIFQNPVIIDSLKNLFLYEIKSALILSSEILVICIIMGLLKSLSDGFGNKSITQMSLLVTTMVIIGISLHSFQQSYQLAMDAVSSMVLTMELLLPVLIGILAATGAITSGTILSPIILGAVTGSAFLIKTFLLPAIFTSTILFLINCLTEQNYVNKLAKLLRTAALFLTGLMLTILTGIITLQGLLTETSDNLLINATKYSLSNFIPIVGGFTSDTVELFLRCMSSIKNILGVFGIIFLVLLMLVPLIKIFLIGFIYKFTAALAEPVAEGKTVDGMNEMGSSLISMGAILFLNALLFIIFLTIIINIGGTT